MDKKTKVIILGGAALVTGTAAYYVVKKQKAKKLLQQSSSYNQMNTLPVNSSNSGTYTVNNQLTTSNTSASAGFPLQTGSRGENVKTLQRTLNSKINAGLVVDGIFGAKTAAALQKAIGKSSITQMDFQVFTGQNVTATKTGNILLDSLSMINPLFSLFKKK